MLLELIYPNVCGICKKINKQSLCENCKKKMECITISKIDNYKNDNTKYFDKHGYLFKYDGQIRKLILDYKFEEKAYLYKTFSKMILDNKIICNFIMEYDMIIPVPINKKRYYERGYNQSELIANEIAKRYKYIYKDVLIKNKNNITQSTLNKEERIQNVKNVYELKNQSIVKDKNILLIDDIYTTGNTVNECARVLKKGNAHEIGVLTIAKD